MEFQIITTRRSGMFRGVEMRQDALLFPRLHALALNEGAPSFKGHLRLEWEADGAFSAWSPEKWWKNMPESLKGDILRSLIHLFQVEDSTNRVLRRGEFAQIEARMPAHCHAGVGHWHANIRLCECEEQDLVDARRDHAAIGGFIVDFHWAAGLAPRDSWFVDDKDDEEDPKAPEIDVSIDAMD
jgi:hypothetical protein